MQQLSGQDAMFIYGESPTMPMHISLIQIYDPSTAPGGAVRFKDILRTFEQRLHRSPVFTRRLAVVPMGLDHPFWVQDQEIDLEYHVRHIGLPKPGDWRQFCILIGRLHARGLDRSHPLWEATIIEGLDRVEGLPPGSFAMMLKVHHAAIDGASGMELLRALHDTDPQPRPPRAHPAPKRERTPSDAALISRALGSAARQPVVLADLVKRSIPAWKRVQEMRKGESYRPLGEKQRTRFNGRVSAHRVFGGVDLSLAEVAAVKRRVEGATVNDVMLTIAGGALRRYLGACGELPPQPLVAATPISTRTESEKDKGGNLVAAMVISLRTDVADPLERLRLVREAAVGSKAYINAMGARLMTDWSNQMPSQIAALGFRAAAATGLMARGKPAANTVLTNVPGPQQPLYMTGARMLRSYGAGPCVDGLGLFQTVTSYDGHMALTFQACRDLLPDPGRYEECIRESWAELRDAALPGPGKGIIERTPAATTPKHPARRAIAATRTRNRK